MTITCTKYGISVEADEGCYGKVRGVYINGVEDDDLYTYIMLKPHRLPGCISCPPGTAINAIASIEELYHTYDIDCDGDIEVPGEDGAVY